MIVTAERPFFAILLKAVSVFLFIVMTICIKATDDLSAGQMLFFRSLFGMIPLVVVLAWRGRIHQVLRSANPMGHVWRGLVGVASMGLTFYAISVLPLADAILLGYAMPLFVVIFGAAFFHESVGFWHWFSVALGFVGVVVISWPDIVLVTASGADIRSAGVAAALVGAVLAAWAMLLVKQLVRTEASTTVVVWFSVTSTGFSALSFPVWKAMSVTDLSLLFCAGLIGGIAQILMTESYRHAAASVIAPFEYLSIIFSVVLGFLIFGDIPGTRVISGGLIILAAGLVVGLSQIGATSRQDGRDAPRRKAVTSGLIGAEPDVILPPGLEGSARDMPGADMPLVEERR